MLRISRILHAGYVFDCEGVRILFDPIFENPFSRNCHAFPDVAFDHAAIRQLRPNAVFISHYHDDHCSFDSLDLLPRDTPIYLYCLFEELFGMLRELGFTQVHALRTDVPVTIGPFLITPREALDADVDAMFQIQAGGANVLNVVDAWIADDTVDQLAQQGPWDMLLWPFQTMRELAVLAPTRAAPFDVRVPEEFIAQLQRLNPRYVVPSSCQFVQESWSWYNHAMFPMTYRQFQREVEAALPAARVVRMNPSVAIELDEGRLTYAASLPWVLPVGEQDLDFEFDPARPLPSTAAIARHFAPLDPAQSALVIDYLDTGLLTKYRVMELSEDSYFQQPRLWRLALYDHAGAVTQRSFRIHGDSIEPAPEDAGPVGWLTEVPVAKVFGALARGEALTSMYVRVNAAVFDPATEAALVDAEVLDDPLIRCLFNEVFGAYQAAQLARLTGGLGLG